MKRKEIKFFHVKNTECDFCGRLMKVVTQADNTYICADCAREINTHARINDRVYKTE